MSPDVARQALMATHGGLSLEWCATICDISPMALYRLVCALGQHSLVTVLLKCHLPLPVYCLAGGLLPRINPWASTRRQPPPSRGRQTPLEDLDRSGIEPSQSMVYPSHL